MPPKLGFILSTVAFGLTRIHNIHRMLLKDNFVRILRLSQTVYTVPSKSLIIHEQIYKGNQQRTVVHRINRIGLSMRVLIKWRS